MKAMIIGSTVVDYGLISPGAGDWKTVVTNPDLISAATNVNGVILRTLTCVNSQAMAINLWVGNARVVSPLYGYDVGIDHPIFIPAGLPFGMSLTPGAYLNFSYDLVPA